MLDKKAFSRIALSTSLAVVALLILSVEYNSGTIIYSNFFTQFVAHPVINTIIVVGVSYVLFAYSGKVGDVKSFSKLVFMVGMVIVLTYVVHS